MLQSVPLAEPSLLAAASWRPNDTMINWPKTAVSELLGIDYPLIQAPMADGITTPELIAAVSNAGGLGSLGAGHMSPEALRRAIGEIRSLTDRPFAVNLFVPEPVKEDAERIISANKLLVGYREELNLPEPEPLASAAPNYTEQLGVLFEESVEIISFTYGVPGADELESIKQLGITTLGNATHLLEAILLEEAGIDLVVAQGAEAGGHRATFIGRTEQGLQGAMVLLPVLVDHLRIPVIAAGGIMDGRGIVAALALGASGVQLGTAFLTTPESGAHPGYKATLLDSNELTTVLTRVFSGKPARAIRNRFIEELSGAEAFLPGYPVQHALTLDIQQAAAERDMPELMALWAGSGCALCRTEAAAEQIGRWLGQIDQLLGRSSRV